MHLAICLLRADYCRLVVQAQLMRHPLGVEMFDIEVCDFTHAHFFDSVITDISVVMDHLRP